MSTATYELPEKIDAKEADYLYLKKSKIQGAGKGLFTMVPIYKNEIISIFKGEILSNKEAAQRAIKKQDAYFINMLNGSILDSMTVDCFAKYANDANAFSSTKNNAHIALDENNTICLVATRNIKAGEEIYCSYGKKYWKNFLKNQ
ncbi:MAG: SET domain-containing protein-lysine N-methyltransferase [Bacteroidia bacterium]|nr:SET domain-containing protein-lysine N-methyltransferase [Bacteroidia bacterium]